jgi:hypothetical protein
MPLDRAVLVADVEGMHDRLLDMVRDLSGHLADAINDCDTDSAREITDLAASAMDTDRKILGILEK